MVRKLVALDGALEKTPKAPILSLSEGSTFSLTAGEEGRVEIEARSPEILKSCFCRFLQIYVGTTLRRSARKSTEVTRVPAFVLDELWRPDWSLSIEARGTVVRAGVVRVGYRKGRFGQVKKGPGELDGWINYDGSADGRKGNWSVGGNRPAKRRGEKTTWREKFD